MKKIFNTKGVTLAEIMVTMAVLLMVFIIAASSDMDKQKKREEFYKNVGQAVTLMRTSRNYAISNEVFDAEGGGNPTVPEGGFGVFVEKIDSPEPSASFTLFIDIKDENGDLTPNGKFDISHDEILNTFTMSSGSYIETMSANGTNFATGEKEVVIIFTPPSADMHINKNNGSANDFNELEIVFSCSLSRFYFKVNSISKFFETRKEVI